jgi:uncharacterized protein
MPTGSECELLVRNVRVPLEARDEDPRKLVANHLGVGIGEVIEARLLRRAVDARRGKPSFTLNIFARLSQKPSRLPPHTGEAPEAEPLREARLVGGSREVIVVGCGPAGLFAALRLSQAGLRPVLLDRGKGFPGRHEDIAALVSGGRLDAESNFHFGLGGAGTYSDGKLFTRLHHPAVLHVMQVLCAHGAGTHDEILVDAQPHVGTDRWPEVLSSLRDDLESRGCSFRFGEKVTGIETKAGILSALRFDGGKQDCEGAVLAPGNSARELFEALPGCGVTLQPKSFAVGVRMTHPQEIIDTIQYGRFAGHESLPTASYRLTTRVARRGVYTFCMCPGGTVIPTPTEPDRLALNGMSNSARDSGEANAAVVVTVDPGDFSTGEDPLAGLRFQRQLETAAYVAGGRSYRAPAQSLEGFLSGEKDAHAPTVNYRPGVRLADVGSLMPAWLIQPLRAGLTDFCRKMKGLDHPRAAVLGLETRTSSPVRILRGPDGMCPGAAGLFPAGEGSGYAGGIVSSAVDGIRAADSLIDWLILKGD